MSLRLALSFLSIRTPSHHSATIHRRVAIVDYWGETLLDRFVKPTLPISDYRTGVTGISPEDLESGECGTFILRDGTPQADSLTPYGSCPATSADAALTFDQVQGTVASIIANRVIIGHSLWNDFSGVSPATSPFVSLLTPGSFSLSLPHCVDPHLVLGLPHPAVATRDVALYRPFRNTLRSPNHVIGLQTLMWHFMNRQVQKDHVVPVSYILLSNQSRIRSVGTDFPFFRYIPIIFQYII